MKRPIFALLAVLLIAGLAIAAPRSSVSGRTAVSSRAAVASRTASTRAAWTPANLTNLFEQWRSDSGVSVGTTSVWTGRVNGLVLSQSTGSLRPTLATNELNGFSALSFDGVDDFISLASYVHAQPYGFLVVFSATLQSAAAGHDIAFHFGPLVANRYFLEDSTPRSFLSAGTNLAPSPQRTVGGGGYTCAVFYLNGTSSWFAENGGSIRFGDTSTSATSLMALGGAGDGTHTMTEKVVELVGFGTLVAGELDKLWNYCRLTYANGLGL